MYVLFSITNYKEEKKIGLRLLKIHPPPTHWATPFSFLEEGDFFSENLLKLQCNYVVGRQMIQRFISLNMGIGVTGSITSWLQRQRDCAKTLCYNTEKENAIEGYVCKIRSNSFSLYFKKV